MNIDWIIGLLVFLSFVIWSFSYYSAIFPSRVTTEDLKESAGLIADKVTVYLQLDVHDVPVKYTAPDNASGEVFLFEYIWPSEAAQNSTEILQGSTSLPCMISGSKFYFQSNVSSGDNYFKMRFTNLEGPMNCAATISTSGAKTVIPWAEESRKMVSLGRISSMFATGFDSFRSSIGANRNFRVLLEYQNGTGGVYGSTPPNSTNVYAVAGWNLLEENSQKVKISVLVW